MYTPQHFEETRSEVLQSLVRAHPLSTLVTFSADGLVANLIPMQFRPDGSEHGALVGHVARANRIWQDTDFNVPALAVFQGPAHYISPSLYPTKREHGKVVPTWNYAVVQARGVLKVHQDPDWIRAQVSALTQQQESAMPAPWSVDDAPSEYTDALLKALVGIEIQINRWSGKWKVSQNQPPVNRVGVASGLDSIDDAQARAMAALVRDRDERGERG